MTTKEQIKEQIDALDNERISCYSTGYDTTLSVYVFSNAEDEQDDSQFLEDNGIDTDSLVYIETEKGNFSGFEYRAIYHNDN